MLTLILAGSLTVVGVAAEGPVVNRVEPPSWWAGHTHNPVRLLISGHHLSGAVLQPPHGFVVGEPRVSHNGDYLFVDLRIPATARAGAVPMRLVNEAGQAAVPFEVLPRLSRKGRFQGFSTDDVIYLLLPDRFADGDPSNDNPDISPGLCDRSKPRDYHGGDLQGIIERLNYLEDLGVTTVWLTPWYDNANQPNHFEKYTPENQLSADGIPSADYHGYGAVDFYAVEEHLGDLRLLKRLVAKAHAHGIKVVQDQVANHTGPSHPWVTNPPTPTWFNGSVSDHLANSWQIWTTATSNPPPDQLKSTLEGWFIDILPDLNQNDPEVATYLIQNSLWWVGLTGVDAVRQDTLPYVPRRYWAQWSVALKRQYPRVTILGELLDGDPAVVSFFQGGRSRFDGTDTGVDTLFDFPLYYAIQDVFAKDKPMTRLTETLAADTNYVDPTVLVTFLGLHDKPRFLHSPEATVEGLKLAFSFLLTTRGTPLIYYGDEIAMTGGRDPDNRRDFPGGWRDDRQNAFEPSGRTAEQQAVHDHVARLLHLRRELEPLRKGRLKTLAISADTYAYARTTPDSFVIVALNNSTSARHMDLSTRELTPRPVPAVTDRLGALGSMGIVGDRLKFLLPPKTAAMLAPEAAIAEGRRDTERQPMTPSTWKMPQ